jgi:hypothetical protein
MKYPLIYCTMNEANHILCEYKEILAFVIVHSSDLPFLEIFSTMSKLPYYSLYLGHMVAYLVKALLQARRSRVRFWMR